MMDYNFYEDVDGKVEWEGLDYYIQSYANPDDFLGDPEMHEALVQARHWVNQFERLLEERLGTSEVLEEPILEVE